ncbi:MAG: ferritin-like domain-containing protein [Capsulimonadales bacterium]|nr:ferritin-like domain-containing protein [Capsulimonadales bacterium]
MTMVKTFDELAVEGLRDIYDAEHQITEALPKMEKAATSPQLKQAFQTHLRQTEGQIKRLDQVFQLLGQKAERKTCLATRGLIAEANEHIKETETGPLLDAVLIDAAQKVEHYEIASYGTARTFALQMGNSQVANLLDETLQEEGDTDKLLSRIAETNVNQKAAQQ